MIGRGFTSKYIIVAFVILLSVASIFLIVFAAGNPTSSRIAASGDCMQAPAIILESTDRNPLANIYSLRLISACDEPTNYVFNVKKLPESPEKFDGWTWQFDTNGWNETFTIEDVIDEVMISLTVRPPLDETELPLDIPNGTYMYVEVIAAPEASPGNKGNINLSFTTQ